MKHCYRAGIDIGSTTVKLVLLDENGEPDPAFATVRTRRKHLPSCWRTPAQSSAPATCA
mgnify:CR=1 FL=1